MKISLFVVGIAATLGASAPAHADQCAWLEDAAMLELAVTRLHTAGSYIGLCEPCGETIPGPPQAVGKIEVRKVSQAARVLSIDGRDLDLAYVYVETAPQRYENLAVLTGCPVDGVSPTLTVNAETSTGVMLFPGDAAPTDSSPGSPTPDPTVARTCPSAPAMSQASPPALAVPTISVVVQPSPTPWPLFALMLLGSLNAALFGFLLGRRRSATRHRPRAIALGGDSPPTSG